MNGEVVEKRLFDLVKSFVSTKMTICGGVYYRGLRPMQPNATSYGEDAVVAFLMGTSRDVQNGTCLVNVYVSDIAGAKSGVYYADKTRCTEIAERLESFPDYANKNEQDLYFKQSSMIATIAENDIHQHFVSLKMEFKVLNEHY